MQRILRLKWKLIFLFWTPFLWAQETPKEVLPFEEYLGFVKQFHPLAKQANLTLKMGEAQLLKARGAFDPSIEVDYDRKKFKNTEYFDKLDAVFKIPTWYGIELKGKLQQNTGDFLNPEAFVPSDGLYSAGISFSLAEGLLINDRMAQLKQAKLYEKQTKAERDLLLNQVLYESAIAYFNWLLSYKEVAIFKDSYTNALVRFNAVKKSIQAGDRPAIDSTEAKLTAQNRLLGLQQAELDFTKNALKLSNYLWLENDVPIELQPNVIPQELTHELLNEVFEMDGMALNKNLLENHPKLTILNNKVEILTIEKRVKTNNLLPKIDLEYNFYSETPEAINSFNTDNYFAGVNVYFPLFLRKERGALQLAKVKLQEAQFEQMSTLVRLRNKIQETFAEVNSYKEQEILAIDLVSNYQKMVAAEERKFLMGESSLFLVNARENSFIESQMKLNTLQNKLFTSQASLFNVLGVVLQD
ncbi:MAG: TolC family protein [Flavobacteriaceae bacterium]